MFVIMDLEWVKQQAIHPTQLAAIRVDSFWEEVDRFAMLIRPSFHIIHWNHVAFTGYERDEFRNAYGASAVFTHFKHWLKDDDVLVWWITKPAQTFLILASDLLQARPKNRMLMVRPAIDRFLPGQERIGSTYDVADALRIDIAKPEHNAVNDVEAIRKVCAHLNLDQATVTATHTVSEPCAPDLRQRIIKSPEKPDLPFYYDHSVNLLHSKDCSLLPRDVDGHIIPIPLFTGRGSLRNCIKERLVPCSCCEEQYHALDEELRRKVINSTNFSFVYSSKSSVFHRPSCYQVSRIPFMLVRGATYYDTCIENGKRPCGWCRPKRSDEKEPSHLYPADMLMGEGFISKDEQKKMWVDMSKEVWGATRKLTQEEKVALKRHKTAAKERNHKPQNMTVQQTNDFFTLTQPRFAFWAQEGYSTFHLRNCKKMGGLSNLKGFSTYSDAVRSGYKPCRFCKPSAKNDIKKSIPIYQRRRDEETVEDLDALCDRLGWTHCQEGKEYFIETPTGKWKLVTGTRPVDVYHINKVTQPGETNYHKQHRLFISMTDTVKYIQMHDEGLMRVTGKAAAGGLVEIPSATSKDAIVPGTEKSKLETTVDNHTAGGG